MDIINKSQGMGKEEYLKREMGQKFLDTTVSAYFLVHGLLIIGAFFILFYFGSFLLALSSIFGKNP